MHEFGELPHHVRSLRTPCQAGESAGHGRDSYQVFDAPSVSDRGVSAFRVCVPRGSALGG